MNNSGDGSRIITSLWERDQMSDDPDVCDDAGARTHYVGMVNPGGHNENGRGAVGGDQLWFVLRPGDAKGLTLDDKGINTPWGGRSLAHELGHNYGMPHTNCGNPCLRTRATTHTLTPAISATPPIRNYGFDPLTPRRDFLHRRCGRSDVLCGPALAD